MSELQVIEPISKEVKHFGEVHYELFRPGEGGIFPIWSKIREWDAPNIVTNAGLAEAAELLIGAGTAFTNIAIGTGGAIANFFATSTKLNTEVTTGGGARTTATTTTQTTDTTGDTSQFVVTFNFTASFGVNESGVFNSNTANAGDMLAAQTFAVVNVANGDSLQVTWKCDHD